MKNLPVMAVITILSIGVAFPTGQMWICTETSAVSSTSTTQERALSCRPYVPTTDGVDISVSAWTFIDYFDDTGVTVQVEAESISFERITLQVIMTCSDGKKATESFVFREVQKGTTEETSEWGPICNEGSALQTINVTPEWANDWRCDGCGTYTIE